MLKDAKDRQQVKKYLTKTLKNLHREFEGTIDTLDAAIIQGSIMQLELLWFEFLQEDAPMKEELFNIEPGSLN